MDESKETHVEAIVTPPSRGQIRFGITIAVSSCEQRHIRCSGATVTQPSHHTRIKSARDDVLNWLRVPDVICSHSFLPIVRTCM